MRSNINNWGSKKAAPTSQQKAFDTGKGLPRALLIFILGPSSQIKEWREGYSGILGFVWGLQDTLFKLLKDKARGNAFKWNYVSNNKGL